METNLDLLRTVDRDAPSSPGPIRGVYWLCAMLVVAGAVAIGVRMGGNPGIAANTGTVAYCVTADGAPAQAGLRTGLYTADAYGLTQIKRSVTASNGCGTFAGVSLDTLVFVSAWSADGSRVGNSAWFQPGPDAAVPVVALDTPSAGDGSARR